MEIRERRRDADDLRNRFIGPNATLTVMMLVNILRFLVRGAIIMRSCSRLAREGKRKKNHPRKCTDATDHKYDWKLVFIALDRDWVLRDLVKGTAS